MPNRCPNRWKAGDGMADYTALVEAGNGLVELLREKLTPEPIGNPELIALCSPHECENNQLTVWLYHVEEEVQGGQSGYYLTGQTTQRMRPTRYQLHFLVTAHSKAPTHMREGDQYRMIGAALQVLRDHPLLDLQYCKGSLRQSAQPIHILVERLNQEQLLRIWNNTNKPYKLSFSLVVSGVEIDSRREQQVSRVTDVEIHTRLQEER